MNYNTALKNLENRRNGITETINSEGAKVPDKCPKCGSDVGLFIKGEPVYLCTNKECNKYFGVAPHKIKKDLNEGAKKRPYVNMNVELRKGGRNAVKMSVEDFGTEMEHAYKQYMMDNELDPTSSSNRKVSVGNFIYRCCYKNRDNEKSPITKALYKDIWGGKYKFDSENCENRGDIKMSKKGVPYIEMYAGGDWESPVCIFIYYDGSKFRGYVPLKGNAINRDLKQAFGNDEEGDKKLINKEFNEYIDCHEVDYNINACLEDFLSRVDVKGSYKKHDYSKFDTEFEEYKEKKRKEKEEKEAAKEEEKITDTEKYKDKTMVLNEAQLRDIIKETIINILSEAKSVKSPKLQAIFKQHGGPYLENWQKQRHGSYYATTDIHNMKDDDILGVMTYQQIGQLQQGHDVDHWRWADNYGLDVWAKNKGVQMQRGDRVETLKLQDGMYLVYVERNAEFEHSGRHGGYEDFYAKKEWRRHNYHNDGAREYKPMTDRAKASQELRKNPYFWAAKRGENHDPNSGWNNPERRAQAMNFARQGKDAWGNTPR